MPYGLSKAQMAERLIKSLKSLLWRYFSYNHTYKYIDILQKLLTEYNNKYHSSIKMAPNSVTPDNSKEVFNTLYGSFEHEVPPKKPPKFRIGDFVRISKYKRAFEKGYTQSYTTEIFRVRRVVYGYITQYRLSDMQDDDILGKFYENELIRSRPGERA